MVTDLVTQAAQDVKDVDVVVSRANTLLRQMEYKVPRVLNKAEGCRVVLAVELAFRSEGRPFDKALLCQRAGSLSQKEYQHAINLSAKLLQLSLNRVPAIEILSVQIDATLRAPALAVLDDYNRLYVSKLDSARRSHVDLSSAVYQAAAFVVASVLQRRKPPIDRKRVIEAAEVDSSAFRAAERSMIEVLPGAVDATSKSGASGAVKRGATKTSGSSSGLRVSDVVSTVAIASTSTDSSMSSSGRPPLPSSSRIRSALSLPPAVPGQGQGQSHGKTVAFEAPESLEPPPTRSVPAIPRQDQERRRVSLGLDAADPHAQRLAAEAEASAELLRRKEEQRLSYEKAREKILSRKRKERPEGDEMEVRTETSTDHEGHRGWWL